MLQLSETYTNRNILSLRTGSIIGHAYAPVVNPDNLKIVGWYSSAKGEKDPMILPAGEVRDFIPKGIVVNDHDAITHPDDLVRLKSVIDIDYEVKGKIVASDNGKRIGKVQDYSVDSKSLYIQKLYVTQNILKGISKGQLVIDRNQVVEITDKKIIVKQPTERARTSDRVTAPAA